LIGGKVVAEKGRSLVNDSPAAVPDGLLASLALPAPTAGSFRIHCGAPRPAVRIIELLNQTITGETILRLEAASGVLAADPARDLLKIAVFGRHGGGKPALGFLKGFGARIGAIGLTINLDENALMVVGSDDDDMARCANLLIACGGGIALVERGETVQKLECSLGGISSVQPWRQVGRALRGIQAALAERGSPFERPLFALTFLTFVTLPSLRITARGLVNAKERRLVPLLVEETATNRFPS
jgi:adenine deaminase